MIRFKLIVSAIILSNSLFSQDWEFVLNLNNSPRCFYSDDVLNSLIIGGEFTKSNFLDACAIVMKTENTTSPLGCGFDCICESNDTSTTGLSPVLSIARFNNDIYATGYFRQSNQVLVNGLAKFDSNSNTWQPINSGLLSLGGFAGFGSKLKLIGNKLFVLGSFTRCAEIDANSIAYLENGIWHSVFNFPTFGDNSVSVNDIEEYQGELYVIGNFTSIGQDSSGVNRIVKFDGESWKSVGQGIPGGLSGPRKLVIFQDKLYLIGRMSRSSGDPGDGIAAWDGSQWNEVGGGLRRSDSYDPTNFDAVVFNDRLYVVGDFTIAGGQPINNIASWDGENWCGLGVLPNTFDNKVIKIAVHNGSLVIGGAFQSINGDPSLKYIARYVGPDVYEPCGNATFIEDKPNLDALEIYPNPTNGIFTIDFNEAFTGSFTIYNYLGQQVQSIPSQKKILKYQFDLQGASSGVYFLLVHSETEVNSKAYKIIKR